MKTITTLHDQIVHREKIELVGQTCIKASLLFLAALLIGSMAVEYAIFSSQGLGTSFLLTTLFFALGLALTVRTIWRSAATAYIKGEMLIVRYLIGKAKVTEVRSVKTTRSIRVLGIRFTMLKFKLDGGLHSVLIFGIPNYIRDPKIVIDAIRKVA